MTPVEASARRGAHPAALATTVLLVVALVNLALVEIMFFTAETTTPSKNGLVAVGKFLGLHLALVMIFQLILIARIPWLERRIGMDRLTNWHRWTGFALFWLVLAHPTFVVLGFSRFDKLPVTKEITNLVGIFQTLVGIIAASIVVVVVGFSLRAVRKRLPYELWHAIHLLLYAAITLALIHQAYEGTAFKTSPLTTAYWWTLWTVALLALFTGRLFVPLWRNARHQLRVSDVRPESGHAVSVTITGKDLHRLRARAGQFFIWRFPGHHGWWRANPFSLSAAPDGRALRLTAKAVGTTSAGLRRVPVGTRVYAEGPYGAFTAANRSAAHSLLIAGGIGVTPVRALLEELPGDVVVLYRSPTAADAVLLDEIRELAAAKGATLHLLTGRSGPGNNPLDPEQLRTRVPDIAQRDVYVCGPPAMTEAVVANLRRLGLPRRQIHAERFGLAGGPLRQPSPTLPT